MRRRRCTPRRCASNKCRGVAARSKPSDLSETCELWAARNEQSVNGDRVRQRIGNQFHARGGADRSAGYGGEPDRVAWGRPLLLRGCPRLCWAGEIDKLSAVLGKNYDSPGWRFLLGL